MSIGKQTIRNDMQVPLAKIGIISQNEMSADGMNMTPASFDQAQTDEDRECETVTSNIVDYGDQRVFKGILEIADLEQDNDFPEDMILTKKHRVLQNTENHILNPSELRSLEFPRTPSASHPEYSALSPPALIRNNPGSNLWVENLDGTTTNFYETAKYFVCDETQAPLENAGKEGISKYSGREAEGVRGYSYSRERSSTELRVNSEEHSLKEFENIIALKEGIMCGHVQVRKHKRQMRSTPDAKR